MQRNNSMSSLEAGIIAPTNENNRMMILQQQHQQVERFLASCDLSQYYPIFIEEGFDRPESLFEITENDLIQMQVKRGHRRLLQRAVANAKGIPPGVPLNNITPIINNNNNDKSTATAVTAAAAIATAAPAPVLVENTTEQQLSLLARRHQQNNANYNNKDIIPLNTTNPTNISPITTSSLSSNNSSSTFSLPHHKQPSVQEYFPSAGTMTHNQSGMSSTEEEAVTSDNVHRLWKRKYHRHAKPDTNAPLKPPSAYVMFSNDVRAELKQQNKSFTDLAKIIGDRWKNITPDEKELYETNALKSKEAYLKSLEEYHKTDSYKKYQQYISDFKAKNEAAARPVGRPRKRHRRDDQQSDGTISDSAQKPVSTTNQQETHSSSARQYPFYLLNEGGTMN